MCAFQKKLHSLARTCGVWYHLRRFGDMAQEAAMEDEKTNADVSTSFLETLNRRIFWDVQFAAIDEVKHRSFVIRRVLECGSLADIQRTIAHYKTSVVAEEVRQMRSLDPITLSFAARLCNVDQESLKPTATT